MKHSPPSAPVTRRQIVTWGGGVAALVALLAFLGVSPWRLGEIVWTNYHERDRAEIRAETWQIVSKATAQTVAAVASHDSRLDALTVDMAALKATSRGREPVYNAAAEALGIPTPTPTPRAR
jgi:hypothetical protein